MEHRGREVLFREAVLRFLGVKDPVGVAETDEDYLASIAQAENMTIKRPLNAG